MANIIQWRRDTAANWTSYNPILHDGEAGLESDTFKIKFGNGIATWSALPYLLAGETPEYEWLGTSIRFKNPNGTWGAYVDVYSPDGPKLLAFQSYSASYTFSLNDPTFYLGVPYKSLQNINLNHQPDTSPTWWEVTGGGGSGAEEPGINLDNGQFESKQIVGWSAYADVAGTVPVDGTGGSPNVTIAHNTTTPLFGTGDLLFTKDAANRQGQGVSAAFTIDEGAKGKPIRLDFSYKVHSGTYVDNDMGFYIYDVTNAILIPTSFVNLWGGAGNILDGIVTFYATNSSSYRLILHIQTVSALAYALRFDNFRFSLNTGVVGAIITDWQTMPALPGIGNLPGSWDYTYTKWKREGTDFKFKGKFLVSGAALGTIIPPTFAVIMATLGLSPSLNINQGTAVATDNGATYYSGNWFGNTIITSGGASWTTNQPFIWANTDVIEFEYTVPCAQFSSSMTIVGQNEPFFLANSEAVVNTNGVVAKTIQDMGGTPIVANTAATYYDMTLPRALMPDEVARIEVKSKVDGNWAPLEEALVPSLFAFLKGQLFTSAGSATTATLVGCGFAKVTAGIIRVYFMSSLIGASSFGSGASIASPLWSSVAAAADGFTHWRVRIGKNDSAWAIPPTVCAEMWLSSSGTPAVSPTQPIQFDTISKDTHGGCTTGASAKYTCRVAGRYRVSVALYTASPGVAFTIFKNNAIYSPALCSMSDSVSVLSGNIELDLLAGDTVGIRGGQSFNMYTTGAVSFSTTYNRFEITRIGN